MPHLVVQQRVNRQRRALQQPGLQVRRHARLAGKHGLEPEGRRVPRHRLAEAEALRVRRLHRVGERDGYRLRTRRLGCRGLRAAVGTALRCAERRAERTAAMLSMLRAGELAGWQLPGGSAVLTATGRRVLLGSGVLLGSRVQLAGRILLGGRVSVLRRVLPGPAAQAMTL